MPAIDGLVVCGTRGGYTFEQVQRPSPEHGCPEGTLPCSANSPENTVCYPEEELENCPITEIAIVDRTYGDSLKNNTAYTVVDYKTWDESKRYLVYSKAVKDSLPITTTVLDRQPCLDPTKTSSRTSFYVTELDRKEQCVDDKGDFVYDPRYVEVGDQISEFNLQEKYGVI